MHNAVLPEQVILVSIGSAEVPYVPSAHRLEAMNLGHGFFRILARYGVMQAPSVPEITRLAKGHGIDIQLESTTFYLGWKTLLTGGPSKMSAWRKSLFSLHVA